MALLVVLFLALAGRNACAYPLYVSANGTALLRSAYGGDVVLRPDAGGAVVASSVLLANGGIALNNTLLAESTITTLQAQVGSLQASVAQLDVGIGNLSDVFVSALATQQATIASLLAQQPPVCTSPGGDRLLYNGTVWECVCVAGWSGASCTVPPPSPPPPLPPPPRQNHPLVSAWLTALSNAGTGASSSVVEAHNLFMDSLDAAGLTSKLVRLNTFSGNDLAAALIPILPGGGFASEVMSQNSGYVNGDSSGTYGSYGGPAMSFVASYNGTTGLTPTAGFLSTGQYISHSNLTLTTSSDSSGADLHMSMVMLDPSSLSTSYGSVFMGVNRAMVFSRHYQLTKTGFNWGSTNGVVPTGWAATAGLYTATASAGVANAYLCGFSSPCTTTTGISAWDGSAPSNVPVGLFTSTVSWDGTGGTIYYGPLCFARTGGYSIGYSLSSADVQALSNAWNRLLSDMSRVTPPPPPPY